MNCINDFMCLESCNCIQCPCTAQYEQSMQQLLIIFFVACAAVIALLFIVSYFISLIMKKCDSNKMRLLYKKVKHIWKFLKTNLLELVAAVFQIIFIVCSIYMSLSSLSFDKSCDNKLPSQELFSFLFKKLFNCGKFVQLSDTHAQTFISVNATIFMIYAALWALLSNLSNKNCAGILYNSFLLNIKPCIYKQKRVLLVSLLMLSISCVCYPYELYAIVEALLFCEMICIAVSSHFIYSVFIGDEEELREEIWNYSLNGQQWLNE